MRVYHPATLITGHDSRGNEYAYWKSSENNDPEVPSMGKWDEWFDGYNEVFTSRRCVEQLIMPIVTTVRFGELEMSRSEWEAVGCPFGLTRDEIEQYRILANITPQAQSDTEVAPWDEIPDIIANAVLRDLAEKRMSVIPPAEWCAEKENEHADWKDYRDTIESVRGGVQR